MAKRESTYTQRSFFSRGKAWSVDARRPFVSGASRTRNALASHRHRSRLPLTGRIAPRLYLSFPLSLSSSPSLPLPPRSLSLTPSLSLYISFSLYTLRAHTRLHVHPRTTTRTSHPLSRWHRRCQLFKMEFWHNRSKIIIFQWMHYGVRGKNEENDCSNSKLDGDANVEYGIYSTCDTHAVDLYRHQIVYPEKRIYLISSGLLVVSRY